MQSHLANSAILRQRRRRSSDLGSSLPRPVTFSQPRRSRGSGTGSSGNIRNTIHLSPLNHIGFPISEEADGDGRGRINMGVVLEEEGDSEKEEEIDEKKDKDDEAQTEQGKNEDSDSQNL